MRCRVFLKFLSSFKNNILYAKKPKTTSIQQQTNEILKVVWFLNISRVLSTPNMTQGPFQTLADAHFQ